MVAAQRLPDRAPWRFVWRARSRRRAETVMVVKEVTAVKGAKGMRVVKGTKGRKRVKG
jgi:hypothetical protein